MNTTHNNAKRGFTLIELLVVIAVIALLMAIVLPALRKVKEQAKIVICSSNQRQLIYGLVAYTNDNDGYLPPSASNTDIGNPNNGDYHRPFELNWNFNVMGIVTTTDFKNHTGRYLHSYLPEVDVFNCTASPVDAEATWPPPESGYTPEGTYSEFYQNGKYASLHSTYMLLWSYQGYNKKISTGITADSAHFEGPQKISSGTKLVVQDSLFYMENAFNVLWESPDNTWYSSHRFPEAGKGQPYYISSQLPKTEMPEVWLNAGYLDGRVERFSSQNTRFVENHQASAYITEKYR